MSLLFELPRDLYNEVCCEWLKTIDMGKLDSAMCQSEYRESLLQQLQDKQMEYSLEEESISYYNWMYVRNIPMKTLKFTANLFVKRKFKCNVRLHQVQTLHVAEVANGCFNSLKHLLAACTNITELDWQDYDYCHCDFVCAKSLTSLKLVVLSSIADRHYSWIIEHCSNLHTLEVRHYCNLNTTWILPLINRAIQVNSSTLRVLRLYSYIDLPSEAFNCPNLTELTINTNIKWSEISLHINKLVTMNFALGSCCNRIEFNKSDLSLTIQGFYGGESLLCDLLNHFKELKAINLSVGSNYTDNLLKYIVDRFAASLRHFMCLINISAAAIHHLFVCCDKLESFEVRFYSTQILNAIIDGQPNKLKTLCISAYSEWSDTLITLLIAVPSVTHLKVKQDNDSQQYKLLTEFIESEQDTGRDITVEFKYKSNIPCIHGNYIHLD